MRRKSFASNIKIEQKRYKKLDINIAKSVRSVYNKSAMLGGEPAVPLTRDPL